MRLLPLLFAFALAACANEPDACYLGADIWAFHGDMNPEPNDSAREGAAVLDGWLRENYAPARRFGPYALWLRR